MTLIQGDCLKALPTLSANSVHLILTNLPYGVTRNCDDRPISLEPLWEQYKRILRKDGTVVLTAQFPFTIDLINSNRSWFRYDLVWNKLLPTGFLNANRMPLRVHEHILVFYNRLGKFNPQFAAGEPCHSRGSMATDVNRNYGEYEKVDRSKLNGNRKYPTSILTFQKPHASKAFHPTEKPLDLFKYLVQTYSDESDMILDSCLGSGTTMQACIETNRNCVGIEIDPKYVDIIKKRLNWGSSLPNSIEWDFRAIL